MQPPIPWTQNDLDPDVIELAWGEPAPGLLPVELVEAAAKDVLPSLDRGVLAYGKRPGPAPLRRAIAELQSGAGLAATEDDVYVTGGASQALDLILTRFTGPGDVVLVESPTYSLTLRIMRDHHLDIVGVKHDDGGLDVDDLERVLARLHAAGRAPRLLYVIPVFHNPTGVCLAADRRERLLELAAAHDLLLIEDDPYRELYYGEKAPPPLWRRGAEAPVLHLGSFSKTLAPGLRVGWVNGRPDLLERIDQSGLLDSGGCVNQFGACVVSVVLAQGHYAAHVERLRAAYAARRDALAAGLAEHLPRGCRFRLPQGGFFIWLRLPGELRASELQPLAQAHGVVFAPARGFNVEGRDDAVRLSFSLYEEERLAEGARRLGSALREYLSQA